MTLSIAPGLESNGTCRATELTRGGSMPSAAHPIHPPIGEHSLDDCWAEPTSQ
jgi:hypothetical protein